MTDAKFAYLDYPVYRDSKRLFKVIVSFVNEIPKEYRYELGSQVIRSSLSVSLNIAEGCGRGSKKQLAHFLDIAQGSLYEVLATCDILRDNELISDSQFDDVHTQIVGISNQLGGFKKSVSVKD